MKLLRWIICFPLAALAAFTVFAALGSIGVSATYFQGDFVRSIVGVAPYFLLSTLPNAVFVVCATLVAPTRKKLVVAVAALSASIFSLQAAFVFLTATPAFDILGLVASFSGVIAGAFVALRLSAVRKSQNA